MAIRSLIFLAVLSLFVLCLVSLAVANQLRARRIARQSWEHLLGRLLRVDRYKIRQVASGFLDTEGSAGSEEELDPQEIWDLLGGLEGLEALGKNCSVLVEVACYVQTTYPEALIVAEHLRLSAREVNWHIARLRTSSRVESLHASFPQYAQRAAATYYQMTESVLALSQVAHFPRHSDLQAAL